MILSRNCLHSLKLISYDSSIGQIQKYLARLFPCSFVNVAGAPRCCRLAEFHCSLHFTSPERWVMRFLSTLSIKIIVVSILSKAIVFFHGADLLIQLLGVLWLLNWVLARRSCSASSHCPSPNLEVANFREWVVSALEYIQQSFLDQLHTPR